MQFLNFQPKPDAQSFRVCLRNFHYFRFVYIVCILVVLMSLERAVRAKVSHRHFLFFPCLLLRSCYYYYNINNN